MTATPYSIMHGSVYRLKEAVKGTGVYGHLARLRREQFFPPGEIEASQTWRLQALLRQARDHSPYYRELFAKAGIEISDRFRLDDLPHIPLLRRQDLQANLERIICGDPKKLLYNSSGGSTGNPVNFYQDSYYVNYARAANLLFMDWVNIRSGDKTAVFWGADRDFGEMSFRQKAWHKFDRVKALNSFSMTEEGIWEFLNELNEFKPRYIHGYAGSLYFVAQVINKGAPVKFQPVAIRSSAEMLYDYQRVEIEKAFNARVFNFYGSREVNNLAAECSAHEGLHVFSSGRIVEIVDDAGRPVPDGLPGQIAVTDLTNLSFPFIRYLNGDMAVKSNRSCSCGRGYPLLEKIEGRTTDMIIIDGRIIHGEYFTHLFYKRPEIRQFQVIQESADHLRIIIVANNGQANIDDILAAIRSKVGDRIRLDVEYSDRIAVTGTGKYRFTISKLHEAGRDASRAGAGDEAR